MDLELTECGADGLQIGIEVWLWSCVALKRTDERVLRRGLGGDGRMEIVAEGEKHT